MNVTNSPLELDWLDLECFQDEKVLRWEFFTFILSKVITPYALQYYDDLIDTHTEIYLPDSIDLCVPSADKRIALIALPQYVTNPWQKENNGFEYSLEIVALAEQKTL